MSNAPRQIRLDSLGDHPDLQARCGLDMAHVERLRAQLREDGELDPIKVIREGRTNWPWDGLHRVYVYRDEKRKTIYADMAPGTLDDAILLAIGTANLGNKWQLPRSSADKHRAVSIALQRESWTEWNANNREVARRCGVSEGLVRIVRGELAAQITQRTDVAGGVSGIRREDFDALSPEAKIRLQQKLEERAQKQREAEERRAAESCEETPDVEVVRLMLPGDLLDRIDAAARRSRRDRTTEILRNLEKSYGQKKGR